MKPILVRVCGYILELEDDCIYVGTTLNLNQRLSQHWDGDGSNWTAAHRPVRLLEVVFDVDDDWENDTTLALMYALGSEKVRGGSWCRIELQSDPTAEEEEEDMGNLLEEVAELEKKVSAALEECSSLSASLHTVEQQLCGDTLSECSETLSIPPT